MSGNEEIFIGLLMRQIMREIFKLTFSFLRIAQRYRKRNDRELEHRGYGMYSILGIGNFNLTKVFSELSEFSQRESRKFSMRC